MNSTQPVTTSVATDAPLHCTCGRLRKLTRRMTSFYEIHLRRIGLKLSQYSVLVNISAQPQTMLQLADKLGMDRTTLTRSLKPLMKNGWIAEVAGGDARQRLLVLTPAGQVFRRQAEASWRDAQLALEKVMGRDTVADLNSRLEHALAQLKPALPESN